MASIEANPDGPDSESLHQGLEILIQAEPNTNYARVQIAYLSTTLNFASPYGERSPSVAI
jgi:hypothetical protein